jgi:hypothetical protein
MPSPNPNPENLSNKGKAKATSKPANEVITDSAVVPGPSACEPYREAIDMGLSRDRNARAIWQDLVSEYGFGSSYQSVQRFVRKRRGTQTPEARVVIVTAAGQEAQVDYGTGPMVRDPESRKYRRTRLFVMTLGCSRKSVRLLTFRSSSRIWAELHERAFRRLGGATRIVVLDNLREGVLVPDIYDPALNPLYRDVLAHYGAVAMPCRIQDPDRKSPSGQHRHFPGTHSSQKAREGRRGRKSQTLCRTRSYRRTGRVQHRGRTPRFAKAGKQWNDFHAEYCQGEGDWVNSGTGEGVEGGRKSYAGEQAGTTHD